MKKRLILAILALSLILTLAPAASAATYIEVIPPTYEDAEYFSEGLAAVKLNGKWGYIDKAGKVIIQYKYDWAGAFEEGLAVVSIGHEETGDYYVINKSGEVVEELSVDFGEPIFSEGLFETKEGDWPPNGKFGYVDEEGNTVIAPRFDFASYFVEGLACVGIGDKYGFIDKTGKEVVAIKYDWTGVFQEGLAWVGNGSDYGFVDKTGAMAIPMEFRGAREFFNGFAAVRMDDQYPHKWGFINKSGKTVIPPSFDDVGFGFSEGLAAVFTGDRNTGKWGFIALTAAGAADWALPELGSALDKELILNDMIGKWTQPTNRLLAAEAIVKLIESVTGQSIDSIVEENEFDMDDVFTDSTNKAVTFLKASGISEGVDGARYDPGGTFTRAQMVTMLGRMAKILLDVDTGSFPKGTSTFTDVPGWADEYVGWAVAADITNGVSNTSFDSSGTLSNQHTGVFSYRAYKHFTEE